MALIKSHHAGTLLKDAIVLDLGDLRRQAAQVRERAEAQARELVEEARRSAERLAAGVREEALARGLEQGLTEGRAKGLEEGRRQGREEALKQAGPRLRAAAEAFDAVATELRGRREELLREARRSVLEVALRLAERVVHRYAEVDGQTVVRQLDAALSHVAQPVDALARVHPDDLAAVEAAMAELGRRHELGAALRVEADAAVGRGGCVLQYGQGRLDATLETQLRRLAELVIPDRAPVEPLTEPTTLPEPSSPDSGHEVQP